MSKQKKVLMYYSVLFTKQKRYHAFEFMHSYMAFIRQKQKQIVHSHALRRRFRTSETKESNYVFSGILPIQPSFEVLESYANLTEAIAEETNVQSVFVTRSSGM